MARCCRCASQPPLGADIFQTFIQASMPTHIFLLASRPLMACDPHRLMIEAKLSSLRCEKKSPDAMVFLLGRDCLDRHARVVSED